MKVLLSILFLLCLASSQKKSSAAELPNFLFLLSDDQAWNGLFCEMHPDIAGSKSRFIETPNIARLAREGMRFSAAYSPASVCAPTRISLQTGKSPAQCQWTKASGSVTEADGFQLIPPQNRRSIEPDETTIGELLQSVGYTTAHFGKWHITGGGPESHGYDESDGDTGNQDAAVHLPPNSVDIFGMGERAMALMEKSTQDDQPFFIQMSCHALHYPQNAPPELVKKYAQLIPGGNEKEIGRAAMSEALDQGVGLLLEKIAALGIADNTYVIYMSDNGASTGQALRADPSAYDLEKADRFAAAMGRLEMEAASIEAEAYRKIRASMNEDQLAAAMKMRGNYVIDETQIATLDMKQRGEALAVLCSGCHGAPGQHRVELPAPNLDGFWERPIASGPNFDYSAALTNVRRAGNDRWTPELLDQFLANPKAFAPGTRMEFQGLLNEEDRKALIEHLKTSRQ
jgi:cytochrome c2